MAIKYQMYGIKDESGKYFPVRYSFDAVTYEIRIDAKRYGNIPCPEGIKVENDTDIMTDYFEKDRFSLNPAHPDYIKAMNAVLILWKKGGNHIFDYDMGNFKKRKAAYMRKAEWLRITEEKAIALAEVEVKQYNELCEAVEEARLLSNKINSGELFAAEYERIKAQRISAREEREKQNTLEWQKEWALEELKKGNAEKIRDWAIIKKKYAYTVLFERENIMEYDIIAINLTTGERHPLSGQYQDESKCKEVIDKILKVA